MGCKFTFFIMVRVTIMVIAPSTWMAFCKELGWHSLSCSFASELVLNLEVAHSQNDQFATFLLLVFPSHRCCGTHACTNELAQVQKSLFKCVVCQKALFSHLLSEMSSPDTARVPCNNESPWLILPVCAVLLYTPSSLYYRFLIPSLLEQSKKKRKFKFYFHIPSPILLSITSDCHLFLYWPLSPWECDPSLYL